jgi:hypothetical protein
MMMTLLLAGALLGSPQDDALVDAMMTGCRGHRPSAAMLDELLRMESAAGFPASVRGLMVAAACNESGFEPGARGDYVARGAGVREPTSYGLLQFQAWAKRGIRQQGARTRDPRLDWRASARYWAAHVARQVPWVRRVCGYTAEADIWRAAHLTAIRAPKCARWRIRNGRQRCVRREPRCHRLGSTSRQSHQRILQGWRELALARTERYEGIPRAVVQR